VIRGIEHVVKSAVVVALISKGFVLAFKYFMFVSHLYSTKITFYGIILQLKQIVHS
jgi:hypothetical protein